MHEDDELPENLTPEPEAEADTSGKDPRLASHSAAAKSADDAEMLVAAMALLGGRGDGLEIQRMVEHLAHMTPYSRAKVSVRACLCSLRDDVFKHMTDDLHTQVVANALKVFSWATRIEMLGIMYHCSGKEKVVTEDMMAKNAAQMQTDFEAAVAEYTKYIELLGPQEMMENPTPQ